MSITDEAVEAAAKASHASRWPNAPWDALNDDARAYARKNARLALEAAAPYTLAHLLAFADERDNALGAIRSHITTYELRTLLGVHVE